MTIQRTFSMIKPDATARNITGKINAKIEAAGLKIVAQKRIWMTLVQAETFYGEHKGKPFFDELVSFMTSGPTIVQVLEGDNAIAHYREIMGATNPEKAAPGTLRAEFAESMGRNSVHGSDSEASAAREIAYWFGGNEIVG
ncbi:MAG: nucleoside-diphosphate kinase [Alphaproteobacteria bacterium]|nr:nucleoside-diphosphate kinase [Alphaproteobacteria bacterium]